MRFFIHRMYKLSYIYKTFSYDPFKYFMFDSSFKLKKRTAINQYHSSFRFYFAFEKSLYITACRLGDEAFFLMR